MSTHGSDTYKIQNIMTASPAKLVAMLYDQAIAKLREAVGAIERGDIETRWRANAHAQEIIAHLWGTLDLQQGGEIAGNLDQIFRFMMQKLPEVDFKNDPQPAQEIIGLLEPLARSWHELAQRGDLPAANTKAAAPAPTPRKDGPATASQEPPRGQAFSVSA